MDLIVSDTLPEKSGLFVTSHDTYYAINTAEPYSHWTHWTHWNQNAFQLLYILFRMTVTDAPLLGAPSITIAK